MGETPMLRVTAIVPPRSVARRRLNPQVAAKHTTRGGPALPKRLGSLRDYIPYSGLCGQLSVGTRSLLRQLRTGLLAAVGAAAVGAGGAELLEPHHVYGLVAACCAVGVNAAVIVWVVDRGLIRKVLTQ